jgi:hypothetical protein
MTLEPLPDLGMLMGGIVIHGMDDLAGRNRRLDDVQEPNELLMTMALHVAADHRAVEDVEGGERRGGAVADIVWVEVAARPVFIGRLPCVRSSAWIWLFSSTDSTMA